MPHEGSNMTPISLLMERLAKYPLHERILMLRKYMEFEKPNSIRWKELQSAQQRLMIKVLCRENRFHRTTAPASAPIGHQKAEQVSP
jgi:hypothetical protein